MLNIRFTRTGVSSDLSSLKEALKYDPDQPRHPKGTPEGGKWLTHNVGKLPVNIQPDLPPKEKPLTLVFGGSFNPPHTGHAEVLKKTVADLQAEGYTVGRVVVSPSPGKLLGAKMGERAYPMADRVAMGKLTFEGIPGVEVTDAPAIEAENFQGKLKRTQLADWARRGSPESTVVAVTGSDAAPGTTPPEKGLYSGDPGSSHEGYFYYVLPREESSISSTKIRDAIREGRPVPEGFMDRRAEDYLRKMLEKNPQIRKEDAEFLEFAAKAFGRVKKYNLRHYEAGAEGGKGGQFAPKEGGDYSQTGNADGSGAGAEAHAAETDTALPRKMTKAEAQAQSDEIVGRVIPDEAERDKFYEKDAEVQRELAANHQTFQTNIAPGAQLEPGEKELNKNGNNYKEDRLEKVEQQVISKLIAPEIVAAAKPPNDERPTIDILGGRGGSGKGGFAYDHDKPPEEQKPSVVYDPKKTLVIDADKIKGLLLEMDGRGGQGHLAYLYHEESSHIADWLVDFGLKNGLNVVFDMTMKSHKPELIEKFKKMGYNINLHYMHLPREDAAERSVQRHVELNDKPNPGDTGRLVLPQVIFDNVDNEKNFDKAVKMGVTNWSFWDNQDRGDRKAVLVNASPALRKKLEAQGAKAYTPAS